MCRSEADPRALTDYIIALLKHEKPANELKDFCISQLDDFLSGRTREFVEDLFRRIEVREFNVHPSQPSTFESATPFPSMAPNYFEQNTTNMSDRGKPEKVHSGRHMSDEEEGTYQERSFRSRRDRSRSPNQRSFQRGSRAFQPQFRPSHRNYNQRASYARRAPSLSIPMQKSETRLVIERIPAEYCTISQVNEYFQKFGTVVNITVQPEFQRARIEYATKDEANAAYTSPEVIFNNRFVKVFWDNEILPPPPPPSALHPPLSVVPQHRPTPMVVDSTVQNELVAKKQEALKGMLELQKQKHELLIKYISEQKELLQKLESKELSELERDAIMKTLSNIDQIISTLKTGSESSTATAPRSTPIMRGGPVRRIGRGAALASRVAHKLDLRPTSFLMKPVPSRVGATAEAINCLFTGHGEITNISIMDTGALISFARRSDAEKAFSYISRVDLGEPFQVEWAQSSTTPVSPALSAPAAIQPVESFASTENHILFDDVEMTSSDH